MIIIGIIVSLILFSIIVIIHEIGHFCTSRLFGVKVEEFGLGIPPKAKVLFKDKKKTIYTLNWLPLGGFVRLKGENVSTLKNKTDKDALINKPTWQQIIIILAGVFMNFLLACIIFSVLFFVGVKPIGINTKIETSLDVKLIPTYGQAIESGLLQINPGIILYPVEGSIAEKSGIIEGDIITEINNIKVNSPEEIIKIISENKSKEIVLKGFQINGNYEAGKEEIKEYPFELSLIVGNDGKIGAYLSENIEINKNFVYKYGIFESIQKGIAETYNEARLTLKGIGLLGQKIFNPKSPEERGEAINNVTGPIGLVDFISSSLSAGITYFFVIGAIISINLGVFNLLPIPALDGGRFIFIFLNSIFYKIFGKKIINEKIEGIIHVIFFMFLIALSLIIAYNDINNIISN